MVHIIEVRRLFYLGWILLLVVDLPLVRADEPSLDELRSPDGKFSVRVVDTPLPGADPDFGNRTIVVYKGKSILSRYPTTGHLLDGHWSPDGKYVAVNNRRGNNGDYLWVFGLTDGKAIWVPKFKHVEIIADRVAKQFPKLTPGEVNHGYITATGWDRGGLLALRAQLFYLHVRNNLVFVNGLYRIKDGVAELTSENIERPNQ
ncbi:MAG: hypothetical protein ACREIF_17785 [Chthoniobacterales bacterium]